MAIKDTRRLGIEALFIAFGNDYKNLNLPLLNSLKKTMEKISLIFSINNTKMLKVTLAIQ